MAVLGKEINLKNEGCVAVEHLDGYEKQYARNLWRSVLCYRGFCATPNHAIIMNGKYTSLRNECQNSNKCSVEQRWVNNLRIVSNRYAVVKHDIIITPYDYRFPKFITWIVQCSQELFPSSLLPLIMVIILIKEQLPRILTNKK